MSAAGNYNRLTQRSNTLHATEAGSWVRENGKWVIKTAEDRDIEQHRTAALRKQRLALAKVAAAAAHALPGIFICDDLAAAVAERMPVPSFALSAAIKTETREALHSQEVTRGADGLTGLALKRASGIANRQDCAMQERLLINDCRAALETGSLQRPAPWRRGSMSSISNCCFSPHVCWGWGTGRAHVGGYGLYGISAS